MKEIEFHTNEKGQVVITDLDNRQSHIYTEGDTEFTVYFLELIETFYPKALAELDEWFAKSSQNRGYFDFLRVQQFINCNFGAIDHCVDMEKDGTLNFEFVMCPLRATCRHHKVVCQPEFDSNLSPAEHRVMGLFFRNPQTTAEEIADTLYISVHTVRNHRKNSFKKLGVSNLGQFIAYANKYNLFKK